MLKLTDTSYVAPAQVASISADTREFVRVRTVEGIEYRVPADPGKDAASTAARLVADLGAAL